MTAGPRAQMDNETENFRRNTAPDAMNTIKGKSNLFWKIWGEPATCQTHTFMTLHRNRLKMDY